MCLVLVCSNSYSDLLLVLEQTPKCRSVICWSVTYFVSDRGRKYFKANILEAKTCEMNHKAFTELLCITAPDPHLHHPEVITFRSWPFKMPLRLQLLSANCCIMNMQLASAMYFGGRTITQKCVCLFRKVCDLFYGSVPAGWNLILSWYPEDL